MKASPSALRALAIHLEIVGQNARSHGGAVWTYDDEVPFLNDAADRLTRYEKLLEIAANNAHDSGEEESFEDTINAALK